MSVRTSTIKKPCASKDGKGHNAFLQDSLPTTNLVLPKKEKGNAIAR